MSDFPHEDAAMAYYPEEHTTTASSSDIERVKQAHEQELMSIDGVEGVGIGKNPIGGDAILVYLRDEGARKRVPGNIEGHPVETLVTGVIDALK
ncbi:MAG TPA: hypothetical protein VEM96_01050 [Pyrinomonadaceae bacterium]|nr:hypothetical protein [Pyrinomonadaceae bacterium]